MLKKAAVLIIGLALCAPAMANRHHHHKHNRVVYVVERPVLVETVRPMMVGNVTVVRNPNVYHQFYRYPRLFLYY